MKWRFVLVIVGLCLAFCVGSGWADVILPNTGAGGVGTVDTNYTLSYAVNLGDIPVAMTAYAAANQAPGLWVEAPDGAEWITPTTMGPDRGYY